MKLVKFLVEKAAFQAKIAIFQAEIAKFETKIAEFQAKIAKFQTKIANCQAKIAKFQAGKNNGPCAGNWLNNPLLQVENNQSDDLQELCPICPKAFRKIDFLKNHVWRHVNRIFPGTLR